MGQGKKDTRMIYRKKFHLQFHSPVQLPGTGEVIFILGFDAGAASSKKHKRAIYSPER
jgi:hypothetical protein